MLNDVQLIEVELRIKDRVCKFSVISNFPAEWIGTTFRIEQGNDYRPTLKENLKNYQRLNPLSICQESRFFLDTEQILTVAKSLKYSFRELCLLIQESAILLSTKKVEEWKDRLILKTQEKIQEESQPKTKKTINGYVYLIGSSDNTFKIGKSINPKSRHRGISTGTPYETSLIHTIAVYDMDAVEKALHAKFANKRLKGEWFSLDEQDIDYICSLKEIAIEGERA